MTLEEKAGQMVMVMAFGTFTNAGSDEVARLTRLVEEKGVGGVILSHGDVYESAYLLNNLQRRAKIPLLVSADLERGLAMRIRRGTPFPDAMAIGATRDTSLAFAVGKAIGREARAIGVHQNYAPVADVNTNPRNPVINTRAFGDDVALVQAMVVAFVRGTQEGGVLATPKHFPGHGDTGLDSHLELPVLPFTRGRLDSLELRPFRAAIESGARSVMIAHLGVPAIERDASLPASLSPHIIKDVLRKELGFGGLVVSDAMEMRGVVQGYSVMESTVKAVQAGTDIILLPLNADIAVTAIAASVRSGDISQERIDASVRKILEAKHALGLDRERLTDVSRIEAVVGSPEHWQLARTVARKGITLLSDNRGILPLVRKDERRVLALILTDNEESRTDINRPTSPWPDEATGAYLTQLLGRRLGHVESIRLSPASSDGDFERALARARRADLLLLPTYVKVRTSSGRIGLPENLRVFLAETKKLAVPRIAVTFGNPYVAAHFTDVDALLCAYGDGEPVVEAAAEALCGEIPVGGKLPVTIPGAFSFGSGIVRPQQQLRRESAEGAGFDPAMLRRVDSIIYAGRADSAFSAAQVAIVRDGMLVWDKAYGTYSYDAASREINGNALFDLASVTKVIATTSAVMKLYDRGQIGLDEPVAKYLPAFATEEKRGITIRHLLLHRGGFPPFRKFWEFCADSGAMIDSVFATPLVARPGDTTIYSDLGFITLGKVVEKIAGMSLSAFVQKEFFGPLGMGNTMFQPPAEIRHRAVATEVDTVWRRKLVQGTVHDENAAFLGGVSGHAGLFSTARDLAVFVQMLVNGGTYGGTRYLAASTIAAFIGTRREGEQRWLGWDRKSPRGSSAGTLFSASSFGHTGFTGTSVWVDPERRLGVIFLTNRVHPTRANTKLFRIRPALHDAVVGALRAE
jgi:beta-glucosidase-like glycosyl hydrolase/CubicO group peptidase (beta-lactamase class C family)